MITAIASIDNVRTLGELMAKFLNEDNDVFINNLIELGVGNITVPKDDEERLKGALDIVIRENVVDTLVIVCLDKIIEALSEAGFGPTIVNIVDGKFNVDFKGRHIHLEHLYSSEIVEKMENDYLKYEVFNLVGRFLEQHIANGENTARYALAMIEVTKNISHLSDINVRDIIASTIVDKSSLVFFLRNDDKNEIEDF